MADETKQEEIPYRQIRVANAQWDKAAKLGAKMTIPATRQSVIQKAVVIGLTQIEENCL